MVAAGHLAAGQLVKFHHGSEEPLDLGPILDAGWVELGAHD
jgi:hypothetical protein